MNENRIILTGASGFLGSTIYNYLVAQKYDVFTLGRTNGNDLVCDLSNTVPTLAQEKFDYVIHAAGLAHLIPKTSQQIQEFYDVNVTGTQNLLTALKVNLPKTILFISSVAVYGVEAGELIDEKYPLNGTTPYANSKIKAENELLKFGKENNVKILIFRLPLLTGKNPKGNLGALITAIKKGYYVRIGAGNAKKSMVSASAVSKFIPQVLNKEGCYNLADGMNPSMKDIDTYISGFYGKSVRKLPKWFIKVLAYMGDIVPFVPLNTLKYTKMTKSLTFSCAKAVKELGWKPESALHDLKE